MRKIAVFLAMLACTAASLAQTSVKVTPETGFTGRGNKGEKLLDVTIGISGNDIIKSVTLNAGSSTDIRDIDMLKVSLCTEDGETIDTAQAKPSDKDMVFRFSRHSADCCQALSSRHGFPGSKRYSLKICADISADAGEGNIIKAELKSVKTKKGTAYINEETPGREILLARVCLYAPGDYGSKNWRIPALRCLPDGSLLAVNDKRKYNEGDLPEDIDIVARRSTDGGRTWYEPVCIAVGQGYKKGFGDPAIAVTDDGDIICAFVGGNGLWASTLEDPQRSYISRSKDGGKTWSEPEDITSAILGPDAENPKCKGYTASFFGSGNGLTLKRGKYAGRIIFVAAMRPANHLNNHAVYSDDGGKTWHVSDIAFEGGDEAKVVELADGRILMSIRRSGERGYSISSDGGMTWSGQGVWKEMTTNACNGDMIRFSSSGDGGECDIILHSIPNDMERRNVSIFTSYDEGKSWVSPKTICPGNSVYSSMTVLQDGTIGIFVEENPGGEGCSLWFMNFSFGWLKRP